MHPSRLWQKGLAPLALATGLVGGSLQAQDDPEIESLRARTNEAIVAKRNAEALPLAQELLELRRRKLGAEHVDVARSLHALGLVQRDLGQLAEAEKTLTAALAMREKLLGDADPLVADSAEALAEVCKLAKRAPEAAAFLRRALAVRERAHPESLETSDVLYRLGELLAGLKDHAAAEPLLERAAALRLAQLPWPHRATANSFDQLGMVAGLLQHWDKAVPARQQAHWCFEALYGWEKRETWLSAFYYGEALRDARRHPEALAWLDALFARDFTMLSPTEQARAFYGYAAACVNGGRRKDGEMHFRWLLTYADQIPDGPNTAVIMEASRELANMLFHDKRYAEAEPMFLDRLQRFENRGDQPGAAYMHQWMANFYRTAGDPAKGEEYARRAVEKRTAMHGAEHSETLIAKRELWECLKARKVFDEALRVAREIFEAYRRIGGAEDRATLEARDAIGATLSAMEDYAAAEKVQRESVEEWTRVFGAEAIERGFSLESLGWTLHQRKRHDEAILMLQELVALATKVRGPEHAYTLGVSRRLAIVLENSGHEREALALYQHMLEVRARVYGDDHDFTLESLRDTAGLLQSLGRFSEAIPLRQRVLEVTEKRHGPRSVDVAAALRPVAWNFRRTEQFDRAQELYQRAYEIRRELLGADHPDTLDVLANLGYLSKDRRDWTRAATQYEELVAARRRVLGAEHPSTLKALEEYSDLLLDQREFERAEVIKREVLATTERVFGEVDDKTIDALVDLAAMLGNARRFEEAQPLYERALALREKLAGPDSAETANNCRNLAWCLRERLQIDEAEALYRRALEIRRKIYGDVHRETAAVYENLGDTFNKAGRLKEAREAYEKRLQILEQLEGPDSATLLTALGDLVLCNYNLGDLKRSRATAERALRISQTAWGEDHPKTAVAHNSLGIAQYQMGDLAEAEKNFSAALPTFERVFGEEDQQTAICRSMLGNVYNSLGAYAKSEAIYRKAAATFERVFGPNNSATTAAWTFLATAIAQQGRAAEALPIIDRAVQGSINEVGRDHPQTASILASRAMISSQVAGSVGSVADLETALRTRREKIGNDDPQLAPVLGALAMLKAQGGDFPDALRQIEEASAIGRKGTGTMPASALILNRIEALLRWRVGDDAAACKVAFVDQKETELALGNVLSFAAEQERLQFSQSQAPFDLLLRAGDPEALARAVLRWKGVVLDSLLEDRLVAQAAIRPEQRERLSALQNAKRQLFELNGAAPAGADAAVRENREKQRRALEEQISSAERALARDVEGLGRSRRALKVTPEEVRAAIPRDGALLEYIRALRPDGFGWTPVYAALLVRPGTAPEIIALGDAEPIEDQVRRYRTAARGRADETTLREVLKTLHRLLVAPIAQRLSPETTRLIVSPDSELNFVSFATLLDPEDRFLAERYRVNYVAAGRDLLRETKPPGARQLAIFAAPDFDRTSTEPPPVRVAESGNADRDWKGGSFRPLPGALREAEELAALARREGWAVETATGEPASEARLARLVAPRILHIATHGYFLPAALAPAADPLALANLTGQAAATRVPNPMHRSGLALSGAQGTLAAWQRGEVPPSSNDGLVTAEEVGGLSLEGTWLVTLSACDTGTGEVRAGEGVLGLRRGFAQAGAQNLLLTLWPINDRATVDLMLAFYERALGSGDAALALAEVQRDALVQLRESRGLLKAVQLAGPFILSTQGRP